MIKKIALEQVPALPQTKINPAKAKAEKLQTLEVKDEFQKSSPHKRRGVHRNIFAIANAFDGFSNMLGSSGKFFVMFNAILGGAPGGLTAIMGIMGATQSIADGASEAKYAAVNRSLYGGISGTLELAGGIGILVSSIGFGPIPALVGMGAFLGRFGYQIAHALHNASKHKPAPKTETSA